MSSLFDHGLARRDANYEPLTPVDFIARAAQVYGNRLAVVHGAVRRTWAQTYERAQRLAGALAAAGIQRGDTVAVMLPNIPAMVEALSACRCWAPCSTPSTPAWIRPACCSCWATARPAR